MHTNEFMQKCLVESARHEYITWENTEAVTAEYRVVVSLLVTPNPKILKSMLNKALSLIIGRETGLKGFDTLTYIKKGSDGRHHTAIFTAYMQVVPNHPTSIISERLHANIKSRFVLDIEILIENM